MNENLIFYNFLKENPDSPLLKDFLEYQNRFEDLFKDGNLNVVGGKLVFVKAPAFEEKDITPEDEKVSKQETKEQTITKLYDLAYSNNNPYIEKTCILSSLRKEYDIVDGRFSLNEHPAIELLKYIEEEKIYQKVAAATWGGYESNDWGIKEKHGLIWNIPEIGKVTLKISDRRYPEEESLFDYLKRIDVSSGYAHYSSRTQKQLFQIALLYGDHGMIMRILFSKISSRTRNMIMKELVKGKMSPHLRAFIADYL